MKLSSIIRNSLLTGVCIGLLSGCTWFENWPPKEDKTASVAPPPSQGNVVQTAGGTWLQNTPNATQTAQVPSHQQPMGLNIDEASAQRIAQLEAEVANLRNELRTMMPAVAKLAAAQGDLNEALAHIQPAAGAARIPVPSMQAAAAQPVSLATPPVPQTAPVPAQAVEAYEDYDYDAESDYVAEGPSVAKPAVATPQDVSWYEQQERQKRAAQQVAAVEPAAAAASKPATVAAAPTPAPAPSVAASPASMPTANVQNDASGVFVRNLRFGEHADKTRLVLDTSDQVTFRYDIDNSEKLLVIEMPQTGWRGSESMDITNSPLVSSYSVVSDNNGGHQLIMQLKEPAQVLWAQALMPGGPQGHRIVIDLAPI